MLRSMEENNCKSFFWPRDQDRGYIIPILKRSNGTLYAERIPVEKNQKGVNKALSVEKRKDFFCWGRDPWNGKVNIVLNP